ncbi:MAG TPA: twin-arginine translocase TatA/TatE family subunit [Dehalococcoidia bacterium]|jgi:Sec-independent protein translocase protein TatA|nr:twin-arginine translocase TatA/TatE family subunit [Dehalococcoidia bacterium]MEE2927143.1 twin-arginine translocase TatA/TatE family subunit [Chloroflexota bacterium]HIB11279.1 twin-arginine translocase TatA/TatE family subunit [Dehalococcoidia bacterium]HIM47577.1 twin-arginine translocase TatA/TatE family subunit [Dehalococcoidia bacterium]|tara:strand:+ start:489 stop:773 length:285 start_codon:yes stop_codon:yes gene_type:complete
MNFMGMGIMELAVIFLVSFLVLGPSKSIDMARTAGKVIRDLRSAMSDLTSAVDLDQTSPPSASSQASMTAPTIEIQPGVAVPLEENTPGKPEDE